MVGVKGVGKAINVGVEASYRYGRGDGGLRRSQPNGDAFVALSQRYHCSNATANFWV